MSIKEQNRGLNRKSQGSIGTTREYFESNIGRNKSSSPIETKESAHLSGNGDSKNKFSSLRNFLSLKTKLITSDESLANQPIEAQQELRSQQSVPLKSFVDANREINFPPKAIDFHRVNKVFPSGIRK